MLSPELTFLEGARNNLANLSDSYTLLDPRQGTLTIPTSTAVEALQSNEVYLPRTLQRQDRALSARQTNAIPEAAQVHP